MAKKVEIEQQEIEAPYELPEGWKWCRLGDVAHFERGIIFPASAKELEKNENNIPCLRTANVQENVDFDNLIYVDKSFMKNNAEKFVKPNDIIFSSANSRELVGKSSFIYSIPFSMTFGGFILCIRPKSSNSKFLFYFLRLHFLLGRFMGKSSQTTNIANINTESLSNVIIPLPPTLAEQERIVNRIETLFAKLDEAKEKAQNVVDSFETRKAAILHQAFTGKLTAHWREENGVSDDSWEEKTVGDCCSEVKVGIVIKPTRYYTESENGVPAFRSANVRENHIDNFDWVYINDEGMKNEQRSIVHTNDVLVVRSGAPGTACVVTEQFDGYNAIDILIAVPLPEVINSYFLCYYTNSPMGKNIVAEKKRGLGLTHFNVKGYSATPIKVPFLPEQQEIVRILDTVLEKERTAREAAEKVLEQIDLLKKSILARAFRGEL